MIGRAPRSIQTRMLALSAIATSIALAVAGLFMAGVLARAVTGGIDRRLDAELALLATAVSDRGVDTARLARVRSALEAGAGWDWRIDLAGAHVGAAELDGDDPPPPFERGRAPRDRRVSPLDGHDPHGAPFHARRLVLATRAGDAVLTASAPRDVIARPVREALVPLLVTLAVLGATIGGAAVAQVRLGLAPLRRLGAAVAAVRTGRSDGVAEDQPDELRPLAAELNALIRDNAAALASARLAAANLAHALKTPVATLSLALADDPRLAQVERIDATVRHHLARARSGVDRHATARLAPAVAGIVAVVARLQADCGVAIDVAVPQALTVAVERADLDEIVGNLIDNAVRHARTRTGIEARRDGRAIALTVADDGPGIAAEDRARASRPGVRLDERGDGHGFGLAIVRDLAALYGGALALDEAPGGGLRATVTLPAASGPV